MVYLSKQNAEASGLTHILAADASGSRQGEPRQRRTVELDLARKPSATPSQHDYIRAASLARGGGSEGDTGSTGTGEPELRLFECHPGFLSQAA